MKALLLYLLCFSFLTLTTDKFSEISFSKITTCELLKETASLLKKAIPNQEKYGMKSFYIDCENIKVYGFNIHDMLDTTNYMQYNKGKFKMIPNHLYHVYSWQYEFSISNLMYLDEKGKLTFFEAVSCSDRGNSLKDVEDFINTTVTSEKERDELLKILPLYRKFKFDIGHC